MHDGEDFHFTDEENVSQGVQVTALDHLGVVQPRQIRSRDL